MAGGLDALGAEHGHGGGDHSSNVCWNQLEFLLTQLERPDESFDNFLHCCALFEHCSYCNFFKDPATAKSVDVWVVLDSAVLASLFLAGDG